MTEPHTSTFFHWHSHPVLASLFSEETAISRNRRPSSSANSINAAQVVQKIFREFCDEKFCYANCRASATFLPARQKFSSQKNIFASRFAAQHWFRFFARVWNSDFARRVAMASSRQS